VAQVATLLTDERLPFHHALCVQVDDSRYSTPAFLHPVAQHANLVTIARLRGTRTLYRPAALGAADDRQAGHPRWYGAPCALHKPTTWGPSAQTVETTRTSRRGRTYTVQIQAWPDLLVRGTRKHAMYAQPFTLVRVRLLDAAGQPACKRDLWLVVLGARRLELTLLEIQQAYAQRFDLEMVFTQMTKGRVLARGRRWDHVTDFHRFVVDDDSVDQQRYQLSALGEVELLERRLQAPTEVFDAGGELAGVPLLLGLCLQLA